MLKQIWVIDTPDICVMYVMKCKLRLYILLKLSSEIEVFSTNSYLMKENIFHLK